MNRFKLMCLGVLQRIRQAWFLAHSTLNSASQRKRRIELNEREAERLDRLRNPSKYRGL